MYLNKIKVKPGNYANSYNVWIPNIAEFIEELEAIKNEKGGCTFFINKNKNSEGYHVKSLDGNLKIADLPESESKIPEPETETTEDELPF